MRNKAAFDHWKEFKIQRSRPSRKRNAPERPDQSEAVVTYFSVGKAGVSLEGRNWP